MVCTTQSSKRKGVVSKFQAVQKCENSDLWGKGEGGKAREICRKKFCKQLIFPCYGEFSFLRTALCLQIASAFPLVLSVTCKACGSFKAKPNNPEKQLARRLKGRHES